MHQHEYDDDSLCIENNPQQEPELLRGIRHPDERSSVVRLGTRRLRLWDGEYVAEDGRLATQDAAEYFEEDVLHLEPDVAIIQPNVCVSPRFCVGLRVAVLDIHS